MRIEPYAGSMEEGLVAPVAAESVVDPAQLITEYRAALLDAGYVTESLPPSSSGGSGRPRTNSREAFEAFAMLSHAPQVLAVLEVLSRNSRLRLQEDFAVSCLPGNTRTPPDQSRASAVSVGWVEVLTIHLDRSTGELSEVAVWGEPTESMRWTSAWPSLDVQYSNLDGGGVCLQLPGEIAFDLLRHPAVAEMVERRVSSVRCRRPRYRRWDWHNRWLWALVDAGVASPASAAPFTSWDVSSDDAQRIVRQRTSQQEFRRRLLGSAPNECAICGLTLLDVLEAAHLVPHARGGSASEANGRLLCANHHRAFDARLYRWTGQAFVWAGVGDEPNLGSGR